MRRRTLIRLSATGALLCTTACSPPVVDEFLYEFTYPVETVTVRLPEEGRAVFARVPAREWVLDEVGQISQIRVWDDTIVGIVDAMSCQAVLLSIASDDVRYMQRVGTCGDGPGEFREPSDLFLDGDTLIVTDLRNGRITFVSLASGGSRELHIPRNPDDPWNALEILTADSDDILLTASLPGGGVSAEMGMLRTVRRDDGALAASNLPDPPFPASNPATHLRRVSACHDSETGRIVIANRWRAERLIIDAESGQATARLISPVPWIAASEPSGDNGGLAPGAFVRVRCGRGSAFILWKGRPGTDHADRYHMEMMTTDGTVQLVEHGVIVGEAHPAALAIAGRTGKGWLLYTNRDAAGPKLYEYIWSVFESAEISE